MSKRTLSTPSESVDMVTAAEFLSIAAGAEFIGASRTFIRERIADGSLPAYRWGTRMVRIRRRDLESLLWRIPTTGQGVA